MQQGEVHRRVGLGAGVGLNVGEVGAEQLFGPLDGDVFHNIHVLAAAVIALAGVAFGVFVGKDAAHGGHDRRGDDVFTGNQLDVPALALQLQVHGVPHFRVRLPHIADGIHQILIHNFNSFQIGKTGNDYCYYTQNWQGSKEKTDQVYSFPSSSGWICCCQIR